MRRDTADGSPLVTQPDFEGGPPARSPLMRHPHRTRYEDRWRRRGPSALTIGGVLVGLMGLLISSGGCSGGDARGQEVAEAIAAGRLDEAQEVVDRWLAQRSRDPEALAWAARVALARDHPAEAIAFARRAHERGLDRDALRDIEGVSLARSGRVAEAEPMLRAYLNESDRPEPTVCRALAEIGMATFRFGAAREALARWRQDAPENPEPWMMEAEVSDRVGDDLDVIASHYREALRRDPDHATARLRLANTLRLNSQYQEAAELFDAHLARHPDDPEALALAGLNALNLGDLDAAEDLLRRALGQEAGHLEAIKGLARLYQQTGQAAEALAQLDRAAEFDPDQPDIPYQQSLMLARLGRQEEAGQMRARFEELRAQAAEIERLRDALVRDPNNAELQYETARWLIDHGHAEEGVRWAEKAIAASPGHRPSCLLLAEYYEATGKPDLASFYRWNAAPANP